MAILLYFYKLFLIVFFFFSRLSVTVRIVVLLKSYFIIGLFKPEPVANVQTQISHSSTLSDYCLRHAPFLTRLDKHTSCSIFFTVNNM